MNNTKHYIAHQHTFTFAHELRKSTEIYLLYMGKIDIFFTNSIIIPPSKKEGHIALHMSVGTSVGMSVSLNLVQLITQERFAPKALNLVHR